MQGVPLLETLQRARKKYRDSMGESVSPPPPLRGGGGGGGTTKPCLEHEKQFASPRPAGGSKALKVVLYERGEPEYERLLPLFVKMMTNVDTAITELKAELRRMAGGVVDADHPVLNIRDYREVYSLQPCVIAEQLLQKKRPHVEDDDDENDTMSSE